MNRALVRSLAWIGLLLPCLPVHALDITYPTRNFGYVIGDVLEQSVSLESDGQALKLSQLPDTGRVGLWFERQAVTLDDDGSHLYVRYQLINSPQDAMSVSLPALTLEFIDKDTIDIPEWPVSINPLANDSESADNILTLQADKQATLPSLEEHKKTAQILSAALAMVLAAWLGLIAWWRYRDVTYLPFAGAYRTLTRRESLPREDETVRWQCVHRAFDATAGKTVHIGGLEELVSSHAWLAPLTKDIQAFFELSAARFFSHDATKPTDYDLVQFCRSLRDAEQRHINQQ